jgi:hypothetical protein
LLSIITTPVQSQIQLLFDHTPQVVWESQYLQTGDAWVIITHLSAPMEFVTSNP